jgi:hypothetical protein
MVSAQPGVFLGVVAERGGEPVEFVGGQDVVEGLGDVGQLRQGSGMIRSRTARRNGPRRRA